MVANLHNANEQQLHSGPAARTNEHCALHGFSLTDQQYETLARRAIQGQKAADKQYTYPGPGNANYM